MLRKLYLPFLFILLAQQIQAHLFEPVISNFTSINYEAGLQNWDITQGYNGEMYFGNNEGVLSFDGFWWRKFPLPGNGVARSLLFSGNRLYVGSYEEFGYMEEDIYGELHYTSLWNQLKNYKAHNDEIWNIVETADHRIIFQSFCSWFEYDGTKVTPHYDPNFLPLYFFNVHGHTYAQESGQGFGILSQGQYSQLLSKEQLGGSSVVSVLPISEKNILLVTEFNGLFNYNGKILKKMTTDMDQIFAQSQINRATIIPTDSTIVLGTIHNGVFGLSLNGKLRWHFNMQHLLANNTILRLFCDNNHNIWAALDAGIALIHTGVPYSLMTDTNTPFGMVYDVYSTKNRMYVATNQATWIYHDGTKQKIQGTEGQNWHLTRFGNQLIVGNNRGTKVIEHTQASLLPGSSIASSTAIQRYTVNESQDYLIESSYSDLRIYRKINNEWVFQHNVEGFQAPIQQLEIEPNGTIWAAHMSRGVYRIELSGDLHRIVESKYYSSLSGTGSGEFIHLAKIRGQVVLVANEKLYVYQNKKIFRHQELEQVIPDRLVSSTTIDNRQFWVSTDKGYSLIRYNEGHYQQVIYVPAAFFGLECGNLTNKVRLFESMAYFCLNGGVGRINMDELSHLPQKVNQVLRLTSAFYQTKNNKHVVMPLKGKRIQSGSNVHLKYSYPNYSNAPLIFCFHIEGNNLNHEVKSQRPELQLNSLNYGTYHVKAEVKTLDGHVLSAHSYSFTNPRPFLLSYPMLLFYILVVCYLVWIYAQWRTKKAIRKQQHIMEAQEMRQQLELAKQQRIIEKQQQQLLQQQIQEQSKDIATLSMNAVKASHDKNEDEYWSLFEENFDLIHQKFFRHLREQYPNLTSTDLKFCALLRLNLSTKDIARFTGLTIRGVEGARFRLRKKLNIPEGEGLTEFLIDFN